MIRDEWGFILQVPTLDPDDSPVRNGMLALAGSEFDQNVMPGFVLEDGSCIRHPYSTIKRDDNLCLNDPKANSRDQLIVTVAGLWAGDEVFLLEKIRSRYWININKDILSPTHKWFIAKAANHWSQYLWAIPGFIFLSLDIFWHGFLNPGHELNQIIAICSVMGDEWLKTLCKIHPNWQRNVEDYFGVHPWSHGYWRGQPEIAYAVIKYVNSRIGV